MQKKKTLRDFCSFEAETSKRRVQSAQSQEYLFPLNKKGLANAKKACDLCRSRRAGTHRRTDAQQSRDHNSPASIRFFAQTKTVHPKRVHGIFSMNQADQIDLCKEKISPSS